MPKLNEYIGSIVSSITDARTMSDIQTVKVAEAYAKHNLLKHFSIPRMKIDDIEMTIPVALDELNEKIETVYEPIDNKKFNTIVYRELVNKLGLTKLKADISQRLRDKISKQTQILEQNIRIEGDISYLKSYCTDILTFENELLPAKDGTKSTTNIQEIAQYLEKILMQEIKISSQKKTIGDLNVVVETHKLKGLKPENLIHIKLRIREDSLEWDRYEKADGSIESKLLPE